jgi:hypothetical protein
MLRLAERDGIHARESHVVSSGEHTATLSLSEQCTFRPTSPASSSTACPDDKIYIGSAYGCTIYHSLVHFCVMLCLGLIGSTFLSLGFTGTGQDRTRQAIS